jgi:hypothetical protein
LFLRLSNCGSVGEKNFENYQDACSVHGGTKKTNKVNLLFFQATHFVCVLLTALYVRTNALRRRYQRSRKHEGLSEQHKTIYLAEKARYEATI